MASQLQLTTSDGYTISVSQDAAECSVLLKTMLEDLGGVAEDIPIFNVSAAVLTKVMEWCEHHKYDDPLPEDDEMKFRKGLVDLDKWDKAFMDVEEGLMYQIILAANYLDIKGLLDVGCKTVANKIKGKTTEQMREILHIENDFTPEEEEAIKRQNEWAVE